jgi:hypothetical protein
MPSCCSFSVTPLRQTSISVSSPLLIHQPWTFFTWWKPLQQYKAHAWSSSSLQLVSSCGVVNSTAGSFLTSWWAAQIAILSWIVPVRPGASPARNCKKGKHPFHWNWPKNPIMILVPMDGVLLEVRNRQENMSSWSLDAMTGHVWTLSMSLFQDSIDMSVTLFVQLRLYDRVMLVCLQLPIKCTPCFSITIELCSYGFAKRVWVSTPYS